VRAADRRNDAATLLNASGHALLAGSGLGLQPRDAFDFLPKLLHVQVHVAMRHALRRVTEEALHRGDEFCRGRDNSPMAIDLPATLIII